MDYISRLDDTQRHRILVFLTSVEAVRLLVGTGVAKRLEETFSVHFVAAEAEAAEILAAGGDTINPEMLELLQLPPAAYVAAAAMAKRARLHAVAESDAAADDKGSKKKKKTQKKKVIPAPQILLRRKLLNLLFRPAAAKTAQVPEIDAHAAQEAATDAVRKLVDHHRPFACVTLAEVTHPLVPAVMAVCDGVSTASVVVQHEPDAWAYTNLLPTQPTFAVLAGKPYRSDLEQAVGRGSRILLSGLPAARETDPVIADVVRGACVIAGIGSRAEFKMLRRLDRQLAEDGGPGAWIFMAQDPDALETGMEEAFRGFTHIKYLGDLLPDGQRPPARWEPGYETVVAAADAIVAAPGFTVVQALRAGKPVAVLLSDLEGVAVADSHQAVAAARFCNTSATLLWQPDDAVGRFVARFANLRAKEGVRERARSVGAQLAADVDAPWSEQLPQLIRENVEVVTLLQRQKAAAAQRGHISNAYGAALVLGEYCDTDKPIDVPGYWMHGWIPSFHNVHYALIALHKGPDQEPGHDYARQIAHEKAHVWQWVSRHDQADYLAENGYEKTRAIGLPMVYLPPSTVQRIPRSLLVMPPHGHTIRGVDDPVAEEYAAAIAGIADRFDVVRLCLNQDDYVRRQWVESFRRHGIRHLIGADGQNPRALHHMRDLLSSFEYVTTNGFGSHIAYAAYWGAKVSIFGPFAEFPRERMVRAHAVRIFPDICEEACWLCSEEALRRHYPELFVTPEEAPVRREWAERELGADCRLSPKQLVDFVAPAENRAYEEFTGAVAP